MPSDPIVTVIFKSRVTHDHITVAFSTKGTRGKPAKGRGYRKTHAKAKQSSKAGTRNREVITEQKTCTQNCVVKASRHVGLSFESGRGLLIAASVRTILFGARLDCLSALWATNGHFTWSSLWKIFFTLENGKETKLVFFASVFSRRDATCTRTCAKLLPAKISFHQPCYSCCVLQSTRSCRKRGESQS